MSIFSRFPYTDFHRLNADWILDKVKEAAAAVAESLGLVRQSAADAAAAAAAAEQAVSGSVRYDRAQQLTTAQQDQARENINAVSVPWAEALEDILDMQGSQLNKCVRFDAQGLTDAEKEQARENIDAVSETDFTDVTGALYDISEMQGRQLNKCVRFDAQGLTDAEKEQARENIDAASDTDFNTWVQDFDGRLYTQARQINNRVAFDAAQSLTAAQMLQARENIGAASASDLDDVTDIAEGSVRFDVSQQLTNAQKDRARENIGAQAPLAVQFEGTSADDDASCSHSYAQIYEALSNNRPVIMTYYDGNTYYYLTPYRMRNYVGGRCGIIDYVDADGTLQAYLYIHCQIGNTGELLIQFVDNL